MMPWSEQEATGDQLQELLPGVRVVLPGHYLARGAAAYEFSPAIGAEYRVVQHGLLVPSGAAATGRMHLLAFQRGRRRVLGIGSPRL